MLTNPLRMQARERSRRPLWARMWECRYLYAMLVPAVALMLVFHYAPMYGVQIAFRDFKSARGIMGSKWVGLLHFSRMLREYTFASVLWNTLRISFLKLAISFPCGVLFALLLNEIDNLRYKKLVQTVSYLPHFISWVVLAGILKEILSLTGPINDLVAALGGERVYFMTRSNAFLPIVVLSDIWKEVGWGSIIYLAAIAGVPGELYESACLDGADRLQRMRHITLPSLMPVAVTLFILRTGSILNAGFEQIYNLYSPIVYDVADILDTYVYRVGLVNIDFSYSTAIGLFKNAVGMVLLIAVNRITRAWGDS